MADTGAPWNIPYVEPTDLVRQYPAADEAQALAVAAGLSAAGGLVAVKHVLFTATQSASVTAGSNVAVTNLSIAHTLADPTNKLIITAFLGAAGSSEGRAPVGIAVADDGTLINIGDADGSRTRVTAGGRVSETGSGFIVTMPSITTVYTPTSDPSAEHTYTVRAININTSTRTLLINRYETNNDDAISPLAVSAMTLMEVKV
jgi:hypothetical protein